jgi:hypothetical protein
MATQAAVAKVRARHARIHAARRRGAVSEDADLRASSGFSRSLGDSHAMAYRRQSGSKLPLGDLLLLIRRGADEMDAVMNATKRINGDRSAIEQGDATMRPL